jgi:hypothetical protein
MSVPSDESDFIDRDFLAGQPAASAATALSAPGKFGGPATLAAGRPPNRDELEARLAEKHQQLTELKRRQEAIERERVAIEESRRRQAEFETGRPEIELQLTRGIELLEKAEFNARREAEQLSKTLTGLREACTHVAAIRQEAWTPENWQTELTRALTAIENARMEWNAARLKWQVLNGASGESTGGAPPQGQLTDGTLFPARTMADWFKLGLALTWPLALLGLIAVGALLAVLLRR